MTDIVHNTAAIECATGLPIRSHRIMATLPGDMERTKCAWQMSHAIDLAWTVAGAQMQQSIMARTDVQRVRNLGYQRGRVALQRYESPWSKLVVDLRGGSVPLWNARLCVDKVDVGKIVPAAFAGVAAREAANV